jgi:hypothetical protein
MTTGSLKVAELPSALHHFQNSNPKQKVEQAIKFVQQEQRTVPKKRGRPSKIAIV